MQDVEIVQQYKDQVRETGRFRDKLRLILDAPDAEDGAPPMLEALAENAGDQGLFNLQFWVDLHDLMFKYANAREAELKLELTAMAKRE